MSLLLRCGRGLHDARFPPSCGRSCCVSPGTDFAAPLRPCGRGAEGPDRSHSGAFGNGHVPWQH